MRIGSSLLLVGLVAVALASGSPASALSLTPDPLAIEPTDPIGNLFGEARVVAIVDGVPAGGVVLDGSVAASDVTIVLEVAVDAGASEGAFLIGLADPAASGPWTGLGCIDGAGVDVFGVFMAGGALFAPVNGLLEPGATLDWIFVSAPALAVGDTFEVQLRGVATGEQASASGLFEVVPEPSTLALALLGLAAFARRSR